MNLSIDIGNTRIKAALFKGDELVLLKFYFTTHELLADSSFITQAQKAIIGSVVEGAEAFHLQLNTLVPTLLFTAHTPIPLTNLYQSSATLGSDRLSASIGSFSLHPNINVLTIDSGTCIKYNFTNSDNEYLGGGISPGVDMRFKALHQFTSKLPLVEPDFSFTALIGTNTQNSILSGVLKGCAAEIDGTINLYMEQYPGLICVLTGGNSEYLSKQLKNSIFAHQNLVLKGLNDILNYNS